MITLKQVGLCFYWDYCQLMPSGILITSMFSENWLRVMKIFSIVSRLIWPTVGGDNMKQLSKISKTLSLSEMVSHSAGLSIFWHWTVPSQPHWPLLVLAPCRDFNVIKTLDIVLTLSRLHHTNSHCKPYKASHCIPHLTGETGTRNLV